jgi:transcriptional regulator with XRE-family HTH domain
MNAKYDNQYLQLGLKVAYYRKIRGLTQEELAERIDKTPAFIGHVEAPNILKAISLDTLFDIAEELGVPAYKFLMIDD